MQSSAARSVPRRSPPPSRPVGLTPAAANAPQSPAARPAPPRHTTSALEWAESWPPAGSPVPGKTPDASACSESECWRTRYGDRSNSTRSDNSKAPVPAPRGRPRSARSRPRPSSQWFQPARAPAASGTHWVCCPPRLRCKHAGQIRRRRQTRFVPALRPVRDLQSASQSAGMYEER